LWRSKQRLSEEENPVGERFASIWIKIANWASGWLRISLTDHVTKFSFSFSTFLRLINIDKCSQAS
jgi:hypothetical protein